MFRNYPFFVLSPGMRLALLLLVIWSLIWKGIALWKAGNNRQLAWFIVLFLVNTVGILEIIYIFGFSKKLPQPNRM